MKERKMMKENIYITILLLRIINEIGLETTENLNDNKFTLAQTFRSDFVSLFPFRQQLEPRDVRDRSELSLATVDINHRLPRSLVYLVADTKWKLRL